MATFVLHANTPCAGKGNVSTLSGPNHSIAVSVAGVGAVFAQFQVWGREDGGEPGKINGLVTVSGTTSATQTVTFTGRYKEIWLELVGISAASTFSATITTLETEFATKAELDAAVAANGGQSLGPSVSLAGVGEMVYSDTIKDYAGSQQRTAAEMLAGTGLRCGLWGTSSDRRCSTTDVDLSTETTSAAGSYEYTDGWWAHMVSAYQSPFSLVWNGAVAGVHWEGTGGTAEKITTDMASGSMPRIDIAFVRPGANSIADGIPVADIAASIQSTIETQFLARGIKVVLITAHTRNPSAVGVQPYDDMHALLQSIADAYPAMVMHVSTYAQFGLGSVTPAIYTYDGTHLSELGTRVAVKAFGGVVAKWGRPAIVTNPWELGEVVMEIDPATYASLTASNATVADGTVDADGRSRFLLTGTGSAGRAYTTALKAGVTLTTSDEFRLWCDVTPWSGSVEAVDAAGVNFRAVSSSANSHRFGTRMGAGINLPPLNGYPIRGLSRTFRLDAGVIAAPSLAVYAGASGNSVMVGRCALIRVRKA